MTPHTLQKSLVTTLRTRFVSPGKFIPTLLLLLFALLLSANAQERGTEFYLSFPNNYNDRKDPSITQKYIRLYIEAETTSRVEMYVGDVLRGTVEVMPNSVKQFDLTVTDGQIFSHSVNDSIPDDQLYLNRAVHVVADNPIRLYGMNRTSYTSDGLLAIPVQQLGKEYVVATATAWVSFANYNLTSQLMITAPYDSTDVTITFAQSTPNHTAGESATIRMNRGDVFSAIADTPREDLSGTIIRASRPVAVTAGNNCAFLPDENYQACDHLTEMLAPVEAWGKSYHTLPIQERIKGDTYRIFSLEKDADIYINGTKIGTTGPGPVDQGGGYLEYGESVRRPLHFTSPKPIMVVQYNNSQEYDNSTSTDPFMVLVPPDEGLGNQISFSTPGTDFPKNYVNLVGDSLGIATAEFSISGSGTWTGLSQATGQVAFVLPPSTDGTPYRGVTFSVTSGLYQIRTEGHIGGIIYGGGSFDSYGYPISYGGLLSVDSVADLLPPILTLNVDDCSGKISGVAEDLPGSNSGSSGIVSIELDMSASSNYRLTSPTSIPGPVASQEFEAEVIDLLFPGRGVLVVTDRAGNQRRDTILYTPPSIALSAQSLTYTLSSSGTSEEQRIIIRNNSETTYELNEGELTNGSVGFTLETTGIEFPIAIPPGDSTVLVISFFGEVEGSYDDTLSIEAGCGGSSRVPLHATVGSGPSSVLGQDYGEQMELQLSITPNPVRNGIISLSYRIPLGNGGTLELFNDRGERMLTRTLREQTDRDQELSLALPSLPSGLYFLHLQSGSQELVHQVLIAR